MLLGPHFSLSSFSRPPPVRLSRLFRILANASCSEPLSTFMTLHNSNSVVVKVRQRDTEARAEMAARIRDDRTTSGNREVFIYCDAEIRMTTRCVKARLSPTRIFIHAYPLFSDFSGQMKTVAICAHPRRVLMLRRERETRVCDRSPRDHARNSRANDGRD